MSRQSKDRLRRARRNEYRVENFCGADYFNTIRAHHEVGHAIAQLHLDLGVERIVLIGSKPHIKGDPTWVGGTHKGLEETGAFMTPTADPTSLEDFWMSCVIGPVAEHAAWMTWTCTKYATWQIASGRLEILRNW